MDIEEIYKAQFDKIYGFFYWKSYNRTVAEDLTSQTFMLFVEKAGDAEVLITKPEKFLYGIMRNVWLRHLQQKYHANEQLVDNIEDFQAYVEEEIEAETIKSDEERIEFYLRLLPDKQQSILRLRLIEQLPLGDICAQLNKDMNYVKTTQKRGIASLKKLIEGAAYELKPQGESHG